jgi:predicted nucleotidyltransferase
METKFLIEDVLGRRVDLVTRQALRPGMLQRVESEAVHVA